MRTIWLGLAFLPACHLVFELEDTDPTDVPFERCGELALESWRYTRRDNSTITITKAIANELCGVRGMVPTAINSEAELDFVAEGFAKAYPDPSTPPAPDNLAAWTGLLREGVDWVDPESCPSFTKFRGAEGNGGTGEDCASLVSDGLIDAPCGFTTAAVICEHVRPPIAGCDAPFAENRYRVVPGEVDFAGALAACSEPNEHVVIIESEDEQQAVDDFAGARSIPEYWIGAELDRVEARWSASTGCPPWFDWQPNQPVIANNESTAIHEVGGGTRTSVTTAMSGVICETN